MIEAMSVAIYRVVREACDRIMRHSGFLEPISPAMLIDFASTYCRFYAKRSAQISADKHRLHHGVSQVVKVKSNVASMQQTIDEIMAVLPDKREAMAKLIAEITDEEHVATFSIHHVEEQEEIVAEKVKKANELKLLSKRELEKAAPVLKDSLAALHTLNKSDINELSKISKPTDSVRLVMSAMCVLMGIEGVISDRNIALGEKGWLDYWPSAQKEMANAYFIKTVWRAYC